MGLYRVETLMDPGNGASAGLQGALVAIEAGSGAVRAMVGGRDYLKSPFNRAVNARRQPGSGFKPFVYYSAFKRLGVHPGTVFRDKPVVIPVKGAPDWRPKNFKRRFAGRMVLKTALEKSVNTIAAQLVWKTGPESVIKTAADCGIESPLEPVYSIALGTSAVSPVEMAAAFATLANMGVQYRPFLVRRVEDHAGQVIHEHIVRGRPVLEPGVAFQVVDMMTAVIESGSGRAIRDAGFSREAAGKTATTNQYRDAWFTGFTPGLSASVWIGHDKGRPLKDKNKIGLTGGRAAAPVWADFMVQALQDQPERRFPVPEGIRFERADPETGCRVAENFGKTAVSIALKNGQHLLTGGGHD